MSDPSRKRGGGGNWPVPLFPVSRSLPGNHPSEAERPGKFPGALVAASMLFYPPLSGREKATLKKLVRPAAQAAYSWPTPWISVKAAFSPSVRPLA